MGIQSDLNDDQLTEQIQRIMETNYDLGKLSRIKEVFGGFCNKSYAVWMSREGAQKKLFLRLYNPGVVESEIRFEHALVIHLRQKGFELAAAVIACQDGATLIKTAPLTESYGKKALWALFEFLEGEDKYTWTSTDLTDAEFVNSAYVLAHFHHCGHGFVKPNGADRVQPRIMEFVPTFKTTFRAYAEKTTERRCDRLLKKNLVQILSVIDRCVAVKESFQGMPEMSIHCDYHPGNLKYRDENAIGIFDFDWSKVDFRLFDVALALVYFTSYWVGPAAGSLRLDKLKLFLTAYENACRALDQVEPLTPQEQNCLLPMLAIANLYVLNWDLVDFYETPNPDDDKYYVFIDHNIQLLHWIEAQAAGIQNTLKKAFKSR